MILTRLSASGSRLRRFRMKRFASTTAGSNSSISTSVTEGGTWAAATPPPKPMIIIESQSGRINGGRADNQAAEVFERIPGSSLCHHCLWQTVGEKANIALLIK